MGVVMVCIVSCKQKNCTSSSHNQILSKYTYNSAEYQVEMYALIKQHPDVDYYFEMREEIAGQNYLVVNAYGNAFCGKLRLVIYENDVHHVKSIVGKEEQGAQLIGLRFAKHKTAMGDALVYQSLEYIVD